MSRRRSRLEIMLDILAAVRGGEDKPTRIMHAINLSWNPTQRILSNLVKQGFLEVRTASGRSNKRYAITDKGVNTLDYFEKAQEILPKEAYTYLARSS